ncbi:hypothetical protein DC498_15555 [Terrimonas sp.]|uniref:hypothetical protein n=1 Tax=Terrimonas sp. TaxID=1914338 RepID=UPI000D525533|nr:hypothetical protein [Terrimonas sp.]PVD51295.1 hypothetical protein DC498_15555 [Terrimonas sp.]
MNEALLIILILITGVTFFNLTKKIGIAAPVPVPISYPNGLANYPENLTKVIYSGISEEANTMYSNLWSVTATADVSASPVSNKITVIYHQYKKACHIPVYSNRSIDEAQTNIDTIPPDADVCVASTISDMQYRHVLLEQY